MEFYACASSSLSRIAACIVPLGVLNERNAMSIALLMGFYFWGKISIMLDLSGLEAALFLVILRLVPGSLGAAL